MSQQLAEQFIEALHALEQGGDLDALVAQHAEDGEIMNVNLQAPLTGTEGARKFWTDYRALFAEVYSDFAHVVAQGDEAALEWTATGKLAANDEPFEYSGVTMLTFRDGKVASLRGYFDQQALTKRLPV